MAKVGDLKAYHDGTSYSVAELYDEEISELTKTADENTRMALHFDTDSLIIEECGLNVKYYSNSKVVTDTEILASFISDEHAKFDYSLEFQRSNANYASITDKSNSGGSFTAEGWFYVDTSTATTDTGIIFALARHIQIAAGAGLTTTSVTSASYTYNESGNMIRYGFLATAGDITLPVGTFDQPFHLAFVYKSNVAGYVFFNGVLYDTISSKKYSSNTAYTNFSVQNATAKWTYYYLGTNISWSFKTGVSLFGNKFNGSISEFKITKDVLYTEEFTPPNKSSVWAEIPIAGNVALKTASGTVYAPLSSDVAYKSPPCLNVRHNGVNYFTVK